MLVRLGKPVEAIQHPVSMIQSVRKPSIAIVRVSSSLPKFLKGSLSFKFMMLANKDGFKIYI